MTKLATNGLVALGVTLALVGGPAVANDKAAAKPAAAAAKPAGNPLQPAITALIKEYQAGAKKNGEGLREKCDYFASGKPEGTTPEVVIAALEKPVPGASDSRVEAYVKWQLLSGIDAKIPDDLVARAVKAYQKAPKVPTHPGLDRQSLNRTLGRIGISNRDAEVGINKEYADAVGRYRVGIEPILEYRDELYGRLPVNYDTIVAGLGDVYDRVTHGAPATEFWKTVSGQLRNWALTGGGKPDQLAKFAGALKNLYADVNADRYKPYTRVMWVTEDKFQGLKWQSERTIQYEKTIEELSTWLEERASQPGGGGLQFKEPEDKMKK